MIASPLASASNCTHSRSQIALEPASPPRPGEPIALTSTTCKLRSFLTAGEHSEQPLAVEPERSGERSKPIGLKAFEPVRIGRLVSREPIHNACIETWSAPGPHGGGPVPDILADQ